MFGMIARAKMMQNAQPGIRFVEQVAIAAAIEAMKRDWLNVDGKPGGTDKLCAT